VRKHGLCKLRLGRCDPGGKRLHKECRWRNQIWHELCQEQKKCRRSHHRLLHVEDVRSLQAARPAKPAKPPDRLRKSSACSRTEASRGAPAAGEEMLPTSGMSAGATAVATDEERRAAPKAAYQARLAGVRGRHHAQLAAMKQRLPPLEARLQELWQDVGGARRPAPTKVQLRATAAVDKQLEKAETLLRFVERQLVPTEGNLTEAEGYLRSAREHLEAAEAQLAPAEAPPMSTVKGVAGTPHSGEAGGRRGHHQRPQERGAGSAMARGAVTTAPQNSPAEQRAAGEQQTAAGRCEREQIGRVADAAHEEQPVNSYQLRRACPEVLQLYVYIQGVREQLSWALSDVSADAIKSHRQALLSEVEQIEGAAV
jgi:hypothetical protein